LWAGGGAGTLPAVTEDGGLLDEPDPDDALPEDRWHVGADDEGPFDLEEPDELPTVGNDEYLVLLPGGEVEVVTELPKPRKLAKAVVYHAGDLIFCDGKRRSEVRTPRGAAAEDDTDLPLATRLVLVHVRARATPPRTRRRRYLIATDDGEELLGWIDHSPPGWEFPHSAVRLLAELAHVECAMESFDSDVAFDDAHPGWVT